MVLGEYRIQGGAPGPPTLCCNFSTLLLQCESSYRRYIKKWPQRCSNKSCFVKADML